MKPVYLKIAFGNVRKSYRDFMIYFMTLTFSVCLFYVFNSFDAQQKIMLLDSDQAYYMELVSTFMLILSFLVVFIFGFLILYANNFLIKRRKKEFGLYMLLGMPKEKISRILVYETMCIGVVSLINGWILGILISQLTALMVSSLFMVEVQFQFVFSKTAMGLTGICFASIFLVIMVLNTRILNRYKLIDLINAEKANERQRLLSLPVSIILFVLSVLMIGTAYFLASYSLVTFGNFFGMILVLGIIGTLLFFFSLSGFLLFFIRKSKRIYYRGLNMFVLKQINAKINTNFISMGIVCLMLLLSIGALATGLNLNEAFSSQMEGKTPYDASVILNDPMVDEQTLASIVKDYAVESSSTIALYETDQSIASLVPLMSADNQALFTTATGTLSLLRLSDYNTLMRETGGRELHLAKNETLLVSDNDGIGPLLDGGAYAGQAIEINHQELTIINNTIDVIHLMTGNYQGEGILLVVNDDVAEAAPINKLYWNLNFNQEVEGISWTLIHQLEDLQAAGQLSFSSASAMSAQELINSEVSVGMIFTFIGLYLGIVFVMASTVILALQQLSDASDNRQRYQVLMKLGATHRQINDAVYLQVGLYFLLPLALAIVHSYVGIQAVTSAFSFLGIANIFKTTLITAALFILIYGIYYVITVQGVKTILRKHG